MSFPKNTCYQVIPKIFAKSETRIDSLRNLGLVLFPFLSAGSSAVDLEVDMATL